MNLSRYDRILLWMLRRGGILNWIAQMPGRLRCLWYKWHSYRQEKRFMKDARLITQYIIITRDGKFLWREWVRDNDYFFIENADRDKNVCYEFVDKLSLAPLKNNHPTREQYENIYCDKKYEITGKSASMDLDPGDYYAMNPAIQEALRVLLKDKIE